MGYRSILISITNFSIAIIILSTISAQAQETDRRDDNPSFKRRNVEKVLFTGVKSFKESEIRRLLVTKPNHWFNVLKHQVLSLSNVSLDSATVRRFYARRGYLQTEVSTRIEYKSDNKAIVTFNVREGRRLLLADVQIRGGIDEINAKFNKIRFAFKRDLPVNADEVSSGGYKLRDLYADNGYPYCRVRSEYEFKRDSTFVNVVYSVAESVFTINGPITINDQGQTRPYVALREVVAKPDKIYRQKDVVESEQRLYSTGLFRFVSLRRDDSTAVIINDTCHVSFNLGLAEKKDYFVGFGLGLGNIADYNLVLSSSVQVGARNIAGTGRKLILSFKPYFQIDTSSNLSGRSIGDMAKNIRFTPAKSTFELDYITPWVFGFRVPLTAKLIWEPYTLNALTYAYRYDRYAAEAIFSREIDHFTTATLTANTEYINIRNIPPELEESYRASGKTQIRRRLQYFITRDTRDNIFVPQRGSYSFASVAYVGRILGGDYSYTRAQFSWSRYRVLIGQSIFANRIWVGWLDDRFKGGLSATEDRFLVGGANTIRGYTENGLGPKTPDGTADGGRYLLLTNFELRKSLFWRVGGTTFLDAGNTYARLAEIKPLTVKFSTGLGIQFFTPIGPIRFDYAIRLKKQFDLGAGLYHLSILYAF
jgi:outer membrane protein insertion porin family